MKKLLVTALFSLIFFPAASAQAELKALIVGLSRYPQAHISPLPSVENDIAVFAEALRTHGGAKPENIRILKNEQATSLAIRQVFTEHLIQGSTSDDVLVFYFSGHGTQQRELFPPEDEADKLDEVLLTWDYDREKPSNVFLDDHMASLLSQVKARHVLVIYDSCHSGTGTRGISRSGLGPLLPSAGIKSIDEPFNWTRSANWTPAVSDYSLKDASAPTNHVYIAACQAEESAGFIVDKKRGKEVGILTKAFCNVLESDTAAQPVDAFQKHLRTLANADFREKYPTYSFTQNPSVESARRDFSIKDYLAGKVYPQGSVPEPTLLPDPTPNVVQAPPAPASSAPAPSPTDYIGTLPVSIAIPEPAGGFLSGQDLTVTITPKKDCYLRVYYTAASRSITQIFPNQEMPSRKFAAGENLQLPRHGSAFRLGPPKGRAPTEEFQEAIVVVASTKEFTDAEEQDFRQGRYRPMPDGTTPGKLLSRSVAIEPRHGSPASGAQGAPAFGYAVQQFRIVPPPSSK